MCPCIMQKYYIQKKKKKKKKIISYCIIIGQGEAESYFDCCVYKYYYSLIRQECCV